MTKNAAKIRTGLKALAHKPNEIITGTVVAGSTDTDMYTISVQPSDDSDPIQGVMLNPLTGSSNGMILFPKDGSDVVIGTVDGPGEWVLLKASTLEKAIVTIEHVTYEMDSKQVAILNGNVLFNVGQNVFKMNTANESLFQFLKDLVTYLTELTVPTPAGVSSVPVNAAMFNALISRLNNLLTA